MTQRTADHPISPLFLNRWSPRAFDEASMPEEDLLTLLEAARFAPSAYNYQPWRFFYALRDDAHFEEWLQLLVPVNRDWARSSSALVFVASDTELSYQGTISPSPSHSFDAGAAWAQFALQATELGYSTHGIGGLNHEAAHHELALPDNFEVQIAIAVGRQADSSTLPEELRTREVPSSRRPLRETAFRGRFSQ